MERPTRLYELKQQYELQELLHPAPDCLRIALRKAWQHTYFETTGEYTCHWCGYKPTPGMLIKIDRNSVNCRLVRA